MSTTGAVSQREARRLATRGRVFDVAVEEFRRTGVADADVKVIVGQAGVAHGTFFFHFPTKGHVLAELGQREEARLAAVLDRIPLAAQDLKALLREIIDDAIGIERRLGTRLFKEMLALNFSPGRPELETWPDHPVVERVIAACELTRARGELNQDADPANSAMILLLGLYALLVTQERSARREVVLEQFVDTMLRGLASR